jgi:hypothetical protein
MPQEEKALRYGKWLMKSLSPYGGIETIPQDRDSWQAILQFADRGLVLPRLAIALQSRQEELPSDVYEYLQLTLELNRLRNQQLRLQLLDLLRRLNNIGIAAVVMKGATFLLDDSIDIGTRVMLDMDIWIPKEEDIHRAVGCLKDLCYEMRGEPSDFSSSQHLPPFFLDGSLSRIELHHRMIHPSYSAIVNEEDAVSGLTEREYKGVYYKSLDELSALRLSYVQCRWLGEYGHITLMKWLDFLDRLKAAEYDGLIGPWEFGIRSNGDDIDARLFTGMSCYCSLPYNGERDDKLIDAWEAAQRSPTWIRFSRLALRNIFDPQKWREKTPEEIWKALVTRTKNLGIIYMDAKNRNRI